LEIYVDERNAHVEIIDDVEEEYISRDDAEVHD
jgi:hypothetical protein